MDPKINYQEEIPSFVYIALGRRGREKISTDQCFLPSCENERGNLKYIDRKVEIDTDPGSGQIEVHLRYFAECPECGGKFQMHFQGSGIMQEGKEFSEIKEKLETLSPEDPIPNWWDYIDHQLGMLYILDENGKNIGNVGYW